NLAEGRGERPAVIDDQGRYSYAELTERANRFANALEALDVRRGERLLLVLLDTVDFPVAFLGAIKAGVVPVPVNTLLPSADYDFLLGDSGAAGLVVSEALLPNLAPHLEKHRPVLRQVIVSGQEGHGHATLAALLAKGAPQHTPAPTVADD